MNHQESLPSPKPASVKEGGQSQSTNSARSSPLKELRKERGITAGELANMIGYSRGHIYNLENTAARPSRELAGRLALLFDTSSEVFFPDGVGQSQLGRGPLTEEETTVLGARLSRLRFSRGYSRRELASKAGLSVNTVHQIENGKNRLIHPRTAHLLAEALEVGIEHFEPYVGSPASTPHKSPEGSGRSPYVKKIIALRVEAGYGVKELAKEVGISPSTIYGAEAGESSYSRETARGIAAVLGVEESELLNYQHGRLIEGDLAAVYHTACRKPLSQRSFAEKVLTLRANKPMMRSELARDAGTTSAAIKRIERAALTKEDGSCGTEVIGRGRASKALFIRKLAAVFELDPFELSGEAEVGPLADRLLELRAGWGGSVRELGRNTGIHHQQLLCYENAWRTELTQKHAEALGRFYRVEAAELYCLGSDRNRVPAHEDTLAPRGHHIPHARSRSNRETQRMKGVLDHCLLALIQHRPRYGFEIINGLDESGLLTVGEGSIYPILSRMNAEGLVTVEDVRSPDTGHLRRYYNITAAGEEQLREWNRQWRLFAAKVNRILEISL